MYRWQCRREISGQRSEEAEVLATIEGTGDDAVNSRLYCIIEACVRSLQAAAEQRRLPSRKFHQKSTPPPKIIEKHGNLLQALDCEQPRAD
jgi:hypothetical protein